MEQKNITENQLPKGPPFNPEKDLPAQPDQNPDPTRENPGVTEPNKIDPTRIEEPSKVDPTRIEEPEKTDPTRIETTSVDQLH